MENSQVRYLLVLLYSLLFLVKYNHSQTINQTSLWKIGHSPIEGFYKTKTFIDSFTPPNYQSWYDYIILLNNNIIADNIYCFIRYYKRNPNCLKWVKDGYTFEYNYNSSCDKTFNEHAMCTILKRLLNIY
jgi:hypothetical protein